MVSEDSGLHIYDTGIRKTLHQTIQQIRIIKREEQKHSYSKWSIWFMLPYAGHKICPVYEISSILEKPININAAQTVCTTNHITMNKQ